MTVVAVLDGALLCLGLDYLSRAGQVLRDCAGPS
jgi:hypothetical protein